MSSGRTVTDIDKPTTESVRKPHTRSRNTSTRMTSRDRKWVKSTTERVSAPSTSANQRGDRYQRAMRICASTPSIVHEPEVGTTTPTSGSASRSHVSGHNSVVPRPIWTISSAFRPFRSRRRRQLDGNDVIKRLRPRKV